MTGWQMIGEHAARFAGPCGITWGFVRQIEGGFEWAVNTSDLDRLSGTYQSIKPLATREEAMQIASDIIAAQGGKP